MSDTPPSPGHGDPVKLDDHGTLAPFPPAPDDKKSGIERLRESKDERKKALDAEAKAKALEDEKRKADEKKLEDEKQFQTLAERRKAEAEARAKEAEAEKARADAAEVRCRCGRTC
jgi:hypothetical protein